VLKICDATHSPYQPAIVLSDLSAKKLQVMMGMWLQIIAKVKFSMSAMDMILMIF